MWSTRQSLLRDSSVHSNRKAPSKDTVSNFTVIEHLKFICNQKVTSKVNETKNLLLCIHPCRCKNLPYVYIHVDVEKDCIYQLLNDVEVQSLLHGTAALSLNNNKAIHLASLECFKDGKS